MDYDDLVNAFLIYFNSMLTSPVADDETTEDVNEAILSFAENITSIIASYVNIQQVEIKYGDHTYPVEATEESRAAAIEYAYTNLLSDSTGSSNNVDAGIVEKIDTYLHIIIDRLFLYDNVSVEQITSAAIGDLAALKNLPEGSPDAEQAAVNRKSAELLANIVEEYYYSK